MGRWLQGFRPFHTGSGVNAKSSLHITQIRRGHLDSRSVFELYVRHLDILPAVVSQSGVTTWDSPTVVGGTITLTLESSDREVLSDLINSAKEKYLEHGTSRVAVHLTTNHGTWAKAVTKSRRALSTLVLPGGTKEMILADAQKFLASEKWYTMAGIPHRRGRWNVLQSRRFYSTRLSNSLKAICCMVCLGQGRAQQCILSLANWASRSISYHWQTLKSTTTPSGAH
ncbi:hypothetical protein B0H13DRAFT_2027158, partial [Mycena leptocephala]